MQKRESHEIQLDQELAELRLRGFVLLAHLSAPRCYTAIS